MKILTPEEEPHLYHIAQDAYNEYLHDISPSHEDKSKNSLFDKLSRTKHHSIGFDQIQFTDDAACPTAISDLENGRIIINRDFFLALERDDDEENDVRHSCSLILSRATELGVMQSYWKMNLWYFSIISCAVYSGCTSAMQIPKLMRDSEYGTALAMGGWSLLMAFTIVVQAYDWKRTATKYDGDMAVKKVYGDVAAMQLIGREIEAGGADESRVKDYQRNKQRATRLIG